MFFLFFVTKNKWRLLTITQKRGALSTQIYFLREPLKECGLSQSRSAQSESEKTFKYAFEVELGKKLGLLMSTLDPEATKWPSEAEGSFFSYLTPKPPSDK